MKLRNNYSGDTKEKLKMAHFGKSNSLEKGIRYNEAQLQFTILRKVN
jgi:hypothetical protein